VESLSWQVILFPANQLAKQPPPAVTRQVECADLRVLPRLWIENIDEEVEGKIIWSLLHAKFVPGNKVGEGSAPVPETSSRRTVTPSSQYWMIFMARDFE
jgi:hypothetical protein